MMYKLDDIDIAQYGGVPITGPLTSEWISLEGVFSMPGRSGSTEYNWGTSIEVFVETEEIAFEGKAITLHLMVGGATTEESAARLEALKAAIMNCRKLSTPYGDFSTMVKDEVKVQNFSDTKSLISIPFWLNDVLFPIVTISPSEGTGYRLDGFNLRDDFGVVISEMQDENNLGKRIEVSTTRPYTRTEYRDPSDVSLSCQMLGESLTEIYAKMMQFQGLCAMPGLRTLHLPDGSSYTGYVKDGFKATATCGRWVTFDFKFRVI